MAIWDWLQKEKVSIDNHIKMGNFTAEKKSRFTSSDKKNKKKHD